MRRSWRTTMPNLASSRIATTSMMRRYPQGTALSLVNYQIKSFTRSHDRYVSQNQYRYQLVCSVQFQMLPVAISFVERVCMVRLYDLTCRSIKALRPAPLGRDRCGNPNSLCNVRLLQVTHSYTNPGSARLINLVQDFGLALILTLTIQLHIPLTQPSRIVEEIVQQMTLRLPGKFWRHGLRCGH